MRKVLIHPDIASPNHPGGEVYIVQPDEDLISKAEADSETEWETGDRVEVVIPSPDGATWGSLGEVVEVDTDDHPLLLMVKVDWGNAVLVA